jgi:hypothetical protein
MSKPHFLSVGAVFKNEAHILKEWLDFYITQGVSHFYLIDNGSTDDYEKVLSNYSNVTLHKDSSPGVQIDLIIKYIYHSECKNETEWLALIDLDEFMYSPLKIKLVDVLKLHFPNDHLIWSPWKIFGTSGCIDNPPSVIKSNLYRMPVRNAQGKCLIRTDNWNDDKLDPHFASTTPNTIRISSGEVYPMSEKKNTSIEETLPLHKIVINHYQFQSLQFYRDVKCTRGEVNSAYQGYPRALWILEAHDKQCVILDDELANMQWD